MTIIVDAQLSPKLAAWIEERFSQTFPNILKLLQSGERFVEIKDISIKI